MAAQDKGEENKLELEFLDVERKYQWPYVFHQIKIESMKSCYSVDEAKKTNNKFLNRYRDVNPYDHSRVILSKEEYNYINASYITIQEARRKYILTQGPLPNTVIHFWLMVWEQNSKAIIMLNKIIEKNQTKCSQYWPDSSLDNTKNNCLTLPEVNLEVELLSEKDYSHYIIRNLRLTNLQHSESREITQYHYTTWPDFGVPKSPFAFLKFLRDIRQNDTFRSDVGPPIVHCSAGIGRSGTFCLVDSCLVLIDEKGVENVNIKDILLEMRSFRMGLIQTHDQLRFSYMAIIQGLKVDWNAHNNDGLPKDETLHLNNGKLTDDSSTPLHGQECYNSESEDEAPPLPPPRNTSFQPEKPLPGPPNDSSDSNTETEKQSDNSDSDDDVTGTTSILPNKSNSKYFEIPSNINNSDELEPSDMFTSVSESRKRKHSETKSKSKRIFEKVQEMKKKQNDAEKRKKKRSILLDLTLGASVVTVVGVIIAYLWKS